MIRILAGDCRTHLAAIRDNSINCVVTSPPYWGLRDYGGEPCIWGGDPDCKHDFRIETISTEIGRGNWAQGVNGRGETQPGGVDAKRATLIRSEQHRGFCFKCNAWSGAFGLEPTYQLYVQHSVEIFREVRRVLRPDGTLWLNLGDSYAGSGRGGNPEDSPHVKQKTNNGSLSVRNQRMDLGELKPKNLIGIPWRVAFALQEDGWYLRQDNIWSKPNPMPESVRDRTTRAHEYMFHFSKSTEYYDNVSHEYVFHFSKSAKYYYDAEAIKEPPKESSIKRVTQKTFDRQMGGEKDYGPDLNRSMRKTVENFKNAVFGGVNKASGYGTRKHSGNEDSGAYLTKGVNKRSVWHIAPKLYKEAHFATFPPALVTPCILAGCPPNGIVLDPFAGSGTVGAVCNQLGRHAILIEQNPKYVEMIERRCATPGASPCSPSSPSRPA